MWGIEMFQPVTCNLAKSRLEEFPFGICITVIQGHARGIGGNGRRF